MNERARAIIFLAIVLAITWILMNSITPLVIKTSGTKATVNKLVNVVSVSKTPMPGVGIGTGIFGAGFGLTGFGIGISGFGIGLHGFGFGFSGPGGLGPISIVMPFINAPIMSPTPPRIQIPQSQSTPTSMPQLRAPALSIAFSNAPLMVPLIRPGGGGGGGGARAAGPVSNEVVKTVVIKLFLPWLLWVLIAIIAVLLAFTIISSRNSLARLRKITEERREEQQARRPRVRTEMPRPKPTEKTGQAIQGVGMTIEGTPVPLRGWGGSKYIDLGIDKDLPLTWRVNDPLPYTVSNGAAIELSPEGELVGGAIVFHSPGCHEVRVRVGGGVAEVHRVLVVEDYGFDVVNTFRANMAMHGIEGVENKTPREVCMELARRGLMSEANCGDWVSLRVFEGVRYGHAQVGRREYEEFIRGLYRLSNALVMGCLG